jgi:hypothetical protein
VRRRRGRLRLAAVVLVVTMVGVLVVRVTGSGADDSLTGVSNHAGGVVSQHTHAQAPHAELALRVVRLTTLAAPVQDAAVTTLGGRVYAFGGLDAAGKSTGTISVLRGSTVRTAGRLPVPIHDAAAASSPSGRVYVMGGGQFASASGIARFDPATARTGIVGAFPTPLSDLRGRSLKGRHSS